MKVAIGINYWDDPKGLLEILTNDDLYDYVTKFYVIDGLYKGRTDTPEHDEEYLYDLRSIYSKIHIVKMINHLQIDKRNMYWTLAEVDKMDYMIVLDSDEYIDIDVDKFESVLHTIQSRPDQCFPVTQYTDDIMVQVNPRLFKAPFDFRHKQNKGPNISHGSLWKDNTDLIPQMYNWFKDHPKNIEGIPNGIPGIQIHHNKQHRSKSRVIADRVYYDNNPTR